MSATRSARVTATMLGVSALGFGLLTACSDNPDDSAPATSDAQMSTVLRA